MLLTDGRQQSHALVRPGNDLQVRPTRESLTALARSLYQALLRQGGASFDSLLALTTAQPEHARSALDELRNLGLVVSDGGRIIPILYHDVVDALLAEQAGRLENALAEVREAQWRLRVLFRESAWLGGDSVGTVLPTTNDSDGHMHEARMHSRVELAAMHPGARFSHELLRNSLERAEADLAAGVRLRVVHQLAALSHPQTTEYLSRLERLGAQVRLRRELPFRLILIDGETAVCRLPWQDGIEETLLLRGARMLGLLGRLFETTWVDSVPVTSLLEELPIAETGHSGPALALTDDHKVIMRYLADGATDQAIAHSLGVTTRTVTRRMNEIYQALGVKSRFQAGSVARRMGLI